MINNFFKYFAIASILLCQFVSAAKAESGYPVPRFVSLGSAEVYMRAGPGKQYPVKWVYQKAGYPVEVIREYETWYKIRDVEGIEGWVYQGLLSGRRNVILGEAQEQHTLYREPQDDARAIAYFESGVIAYADECNEDWCWIEAEEIGGWIRKDSLWGIYDDEQIN